MKEVKTTKIKYLNILIFIGILVLIFYLSMIAGVDKVSSKVSNKISSKEKENNTNTFIPQGRVSHNWGEPLNRDMDADGNDDSAVIIKSISDKVDDIGYSITGDIKGNIYVTGICGNLYVLKLNSNGALDKSFGNNGVFSIENIAGDYFYPDAGRSIYVDRNGKVYVCGEAGKHSLFVLRLNNKGGLDPSFANYGKFVLDSLDNVSDSSISAYSFCLDNKNRIYVTGGTYSSKNKAYCPYILRLNSNGKIDNTFGNKGKVIFDNIFKEGNESKGRAVCVDANGKIYIAGKGIEKQKESNDSDVFIIRLNEDGSIDKSFGDNGKVIIDSIGGKNTTDDAYSIHVDNKGKIYVAGESKDSMFVVRFNNDGSPDSDFSTAIINKVQITGFVFYYKYDYRDDIQGAMYVDSNGSVYLTSWIFKGRGDRDIAVVKINNDGTIDNSFGKKGMVIVHNVAGGNGGDVGRAIYVDNNGYIYVTGESSNGKDYDTYVLRIE